MASKAERTKAFIIEKTSPIFNKKGVAGTSLSDMTEATGLTKGAIYGNFADKDEVAVAAFEHNVERVFAGLSEVIGKEETAVGKLKSITQFYRNYLGQNRFEFGCPMANTATEADDTHPLLRAKVQERYMKWRKGIEKILKAGVASGELKDEFDVREFASLIIVVIQGSVVVSKATNDDTFSLEPLALIDTLIDAKRI